eukprot:gene5261-6717_t
MDTQGIEQMLSVLRSTAAQATGKAAESTPAAGAPDFADILKGSIDKVNQTQQQADQMAEKLAAGDTSQNLHEVMIALQTASVGEVVDTLSDDWYLLRKTTFDYRR